MKRIITALILILSPLYCFGWWQTGHMIVAEIAYQNLTDTAREQVNALLPHMAVESTTEVDYDYNPTHPNWTFMALAHWPDDVAYKTGKLTIYANWHYINLAFSGDGTPIKKLTKTENVVWVIPLLKEALNYAPGNTYDHARALTFLVHFYGDLHQPLHAVSRITKEYPNGDEGGNFFPVNYTQPSGVKINNLHALWDSALTFYNSKGFSETTQAPQDVEALANIIQEMHPMSAYSSDELNLTPQEIAENDLTIAKNIVYNLSEGAIPSTAYLNTGDKIAAQRLALAGYRLAVALNAIFD